MYFLAPRKKDERNRTAVHGSPSPVRSPDPRMSLPKGKHRNQSSTPEGGLVAAEPGTPVCINAHFSPAPFRLAASPRHPVVGSPFPRGSRRERWRKGQQRGPGPAQPPDGHLTWGGTSLVSAGSESALTWEWESRTSRCPRRTPSSPKMRGHRCLTPPRQARTDAGSSLCAAVLSRSQVPVPSPRRRDVIPAERLRFGC